MYFENIIIGAGSAGLQAGYYLRKYEIDYVILEQNSECGGFYKQYPHSGKLLTINKKHKNIKYDYNSIINDKNILFSKYSNNYYPKREDMITYLNEFWENNSLNVEFDKKVVQIEKINENGEKLKLNYKITVDFNGDTEYYECDRLFMAIGLSSPIIPDNFKQEAITEQVDKGEKDEKDKGEKDKREKDEKDEKDKGEKDKSEKDNGEKNKGEKNKGEKDKKDKKDKGEKDKKGEKEENDKKDTKIELSPIQHYIQYPKNYFIDHLSNFTDKKVLLVGGGNSSYEIASMIQSVVSETVIISRGSQYKLETTNYFGHVNSIYVNPYIKIIENIPIHKINIEKNKTTNQYFLYYNLPKLEDGDEGIKESIFGEDNSMFDIIILCTGYKLDITMFKFNVELAKGGKFPILGINYGSINNKNLYFIGENMHLFDHLRSSGGFTHGFRHLIKMCINQILGLSTKNSFKKFDIFNKNGFNFVELNKCISLIIERLNTSSSLYHMAGVLSDKFYLMGNGDMLYLYDIHIMNMIDIENRVKEMENNINIMKENRYAKGKEGKEEKDDKDDKGDKEAKEEKE